MPPLSAGSFSRRCDPFLFRNTKSKSGWEKKKKNPSFSCGTPSFRLHCSEIRLLLDHNEWSSCQQTVSTRLRASNPNTKKNMTMVSSSQSLKNLRNTMYSRKVDSLKNSRNTMDSRRIDNLKNLRNTMDSRNIQSLKKSRNLKNSTDSRNWHRLYTTSICESNTNRLQSNTSIRQSKQRGKRRGALPPESPRRNEQKEEGER